MRFFVDGSTHPELFQMWSVFSSFAAGFVYDEVDPRVSLAEFGFEDEGASVTFSPLWVPPRGMKILPQIILFFVED